MDSPDLALTQGLEDPASLAREIVGTMREPFLVLDAGARVLAASQAFCLRFGVSLDALVGRPLYALGGGEWDTPALRLLLERHAREQEVLAGSEVELRSPAAPPRRLSLTVRPVRRGDNQVRMLLVAIAELSSREPAPPSLQRLASEHSVDLVALYRPDGTCLYASAAAETVVGYSPEEMVRMTPWALSPSPDQERLRRRIEGLREEDPPARAVYRARRRDGRLVWLETVLRRVRDGGGEPLVHAASRDISERQRAEEALRWLSRQTRLILDSAAEGIFGVDVRGTVTFVNPAAARMLGYSASELIGGPYGVFVDAPAEADDSAADPVAATLRDGFPRRAQEHRFRHREGSAIPVEYSCNPARDAERVVGAVVTFRDVTERRASEAALRRSEWLAGVGETVLALRHEINNPLTTLLAEASLLSMGGNTPEEEREAVAAMADAARRIGDVVRRLTERQHDPAVRADGQTRMLDLTDDGIGRR